VGLVGIILPTALSFIEGKLGVITEDQILYDESMERPSPAA